MSAPQTNVERQKRRHRGPLIGIILGLIVVAVMFFGFIGDTVTPETELLDANTPTVTPEAAAPAETAPAATPVPAPAGN
jgi:hypothetical protein